MAFPIIVLTSSGIQNIPKEYFEVGSILGAKSLYQIVHIAIPAALPQIFVGMFNGVTLAFMSLMVAELIGVRKLALKNLIRRRNKTVLTIVISLCIVSIVVASLLFYTSTKRELSLSDQRLGADVLVYPKETDLNDQEILFTGLDQMVYMNKNVLDGKYQKDDVEELTEQFFIKTLPGGGCCSVGQTYRIVGINPKTDFILKPWAKENLANKITGNQMVVGSQIKKDFGAETFLLNELMKISGVLYETGTGMDESVFVNIDLARKLRS